MPRAILCPITAPATETGCSIPARCLGAAAHALFAEGYLPLALNFANGFVPGNGFMRDTTGQEETRCRPSALCVSLFDDPMYIGGMGMRVFAYDPF
ncbi:hypothetical protein Q31b_38000 [Novipirellula aureliae]|uniref:Microbial-type PARG catalytic domain-containing protein n=1 Tax=Novipirellula aureliae TaxID=2527966 RepID=A0A5C6DQ31_9BACT|nr:hypothetical protein Q31b_38000 [Novipirellula aureliae]